MRTPEGAATLMRAARPRDGAVLGRAWGAGAAWALDRMPALLGADDDPCGFEPHHHPVAGRLRTTAHWRIGRTGLVMEALVPSIIEQKVTGKQAFAGFRNLVRRWGEPAPGPVAPLRVCVQPTPTRCAAIPSWEWLKLHIDPAQSRTWSRACRLASSARAGAPRCSGEEADRRCARCRASASGPAPRCASGRSGDADAVSFGDYHVAKDVGWALVGHDITDEVMGELLEPYRPQRGRAAAMAMAGGQSRPRRGPRMSIPTHLPTR